MNFLKLKSAGLPNRRHVARVPTLGPVAGLAVGQNALSNFAFNLNWANVDPVKYLYAGTRGNARGMSEARRVWRTIPESLRAAGPEAVAKHLSGFDWSHITPFSTGGGNDAANGIFERAGLNRARRARAMTAKEIRAAHLALRGEAFSAALSATASRLFAGAVAGAVAGCVLAALEHGLEWQRGEIDRDEMLRRIAKAAGKSAESGAAVSGLMVAVALAFPPIIPLAVMGFCTAGHKAVRLWVGWYEVLCEQCVRQAPSTFKPVLALPPPTGDQESIVGQLARLEGVRAV